MMRVLVITSTMLWAVFAHAMSHAVIICGSGGEEPYIERFPAWGARLADTLTHSAGMRPEHIVLLTESGQEESATGRSSLEGIEEQFAALASTLQPNDALYIFLIGHGSYQRDAAKINIPGPDLEAVRLNELVESVPNSVCVVVNGTSTSAAFINTMSAPGRIIATATKNVEERNATEFMEQFIMALADGSADTNRDDRVSVLEACTQAAELTDAWYLSEGFIATEHGLIDDNGDGFGTRLIRDKSAEPTEDAIDADAKGLDGDFADLVYLADYRFPPDSDPALRARYLAELDAIKALKAQKVDMDEAEYYAELERLLIVAARTNQLLRATAVIEDEAHE